MDVAVWQSLPMIMARLLVFLLVTLLVAATVRAAPCGGDFNGFLAAMARDAQGQGISRGVIDMAFTGVTPDPAVLDFDRRQHGTFRQSFERYAATRVTAPRIKRAKILMQRHAALLSPLTHTRDLSGTEIFSAEKVSSSPGLMSPSM
jgi:membrane-bound lytic murein transglycosylase B